jgi:predicted small metal-binding protein
MAKKPESRRQRRIREALETEFPASFWFKVHGNEFMAAGLPDLIGCVDGIYCGFEVKEPNEEPSEIQKETIEDIRKAGGLAAVIEEPIEAIALVRAARWTTARRRPFYLNEEWVRFILRAAHRENVDNLNPHRNTRSRKRSVSSPIK